MPEASVWKGPHGRNMTITYPGQLMQSVEYIWVYGFSLPLSLTTYRQHTHTHNYFTLWPTGNSLPGRGFNCPSNIYTRGYSRLLLHILFQWCHSNGRGEVYRKDIWSNSIIFCERLTHHLQPLSEHKKDNTRWTFVLRLFKIQLAPPLFSPRSWEGSPVGLI